ncbi:MAG: redoxin domain-containing protein [Acidobacteria bacterium]|nr:redoxin domain-containing protein [Acidobacteriota bacterium]
MKKRLWVGAGLLMVIALSLAPLVFAQSSSAVVKAQGYVSTDAVKPASQFKIAIALDVASGYHINARVPTEDFLIATSVKFEPVAGLKISDAKYPKPQFKKFEFSDKELAVLEGKIYIVANVEAEKDLPLGAKIIQATVTVQSCNDKQCLAPANLKVEIPVNFVAAAQTAKPANAEVFAQAAAQPLDDTPVVAAMNGDKKNDSAASLAQFKGNDQSQNAIADKIAASGLLVTLVGIFFAGLALNLTPCVYPIIPITISFFINQGGGSQGKPNLKRTFAMASLYVLGMALTYSVLGVIASLSGGLFGGALQSPYVLIGLALLMVALSLSMFGVYEFKVPESLNRFANNSTQSTSGMLGALVMGLTMGIVAAPCIGPFVVALLVEVGRRGDPVFGFLLFFVLALGLGFPFLILGTFSGSIKAMPRSGLWMVTVRKVFGLVLIGMALYFLNPLMGNWSKYVFVAFFALAALYLIFYEAGKTKPDTFAWILRAIGVGAAALAIFFALPKKVEETIKWQPYSEQAVADAQKQGKGVIIDSYATWCIPCKELDELTFTDANVKQEAMKFVTLKLDLTSDDPNTEAGRARQQFKIKGVPTIVFLDAKGNEFSALRLEGFEKPDKFLARLKSLGSAPAATDIAKNSGGEKTPATDAAPGTIAVSNGDIGGTFEAAPNVALNLVEGGKLELSSLQGKVVLIDFWATWCVPCISEIPMFNDLTKQYKEQGFDMVAVSLDEEGAAKVKPFLKQHPMNYTQTVGDQSLAELFKVNDSALPVAVLIDKQGRVRFTHKGITERAVFEAQIKQLLGE